MDDTSPASAGTEPSADESQQKSGFHPPPADDPFKNYREAGRMDPTFHGDWDKRVAHGTPG